MTDEKKKVFGLPQPVGIGVLCVLGALCLYMFYSNVLAGPPGAPSDAGRSAGTAAAAPAIPMPGSLPGAEGAPRPAASTRGRSEEFRPVLRSKRPEDRVDPKTVDPTLRLELLTKVQAVELVAGTRNLFQMGAAPPKTELASLNGQETVVKVAPIGPKPPVVPPPPPPQPVAPIPLKFYGFSIIRSTGKKTAYFMDNEDILIAAEGEMVKRRYRVVRIGPNSVVVEDTESKRTQSLPLAEETQG